MTVCVKQCTVCGPKSGQPLVRTLRFIVYFFDRKQSFNKTEPSQRFLDLFAVLTSLKGFPAGGEVENFKST